MANVISLHTRQLMLDGALVADGTMEVRLSGTDTQVSVYADTDLLTELSQPIPADANGVLPTMYVASAVALRLLARDEDGNPLPGYPMDDVMPMPLGSSAADQISASPFEGVTGETVQAQLEQIYTVAAGNDDLVTARFTPWTTGGTGNAYTITPTPAATTYAAGQTWMVRPNRSNTGAATLNVSGIGTRSLKKYGTGGTLVDLAAGEIQAYREFLAYDDGTQIVMLLGRDFPIETTTGDGTSTRLANGTQICRFKSALLTTNSASGNVFVSPAETWTYPQAFTAEPVVTLGVENSTGVTWPAGSNALDTNTTQSVARLAGSTNTSSGHLFFTAIGRWF